MKKILIAAFILFALRAQTQSFSFSPAPTTIVRFATIQDMLNFTGQYYQALVLDPIRGGFFVGIIGGTKFVDNGVIFQGIGRQWERQLQPSAPLNFLWWGAAGIGMAGIAADTTAWVNCFAYMTNIQGARPLHVPASTTYYCLPINTLMGHSNFSIYGDGPSTDIRSITAKKTYIGAVFSFSTYQSNDSSSIFKPGVPKFAVYDAPAGQTWVRLQDISKMDSVPLGTIGVLCTNLFFHGNDSVETRSKNGESVKVTRKNVDSLFLERGLNVSLASSGGNPPLFLAINNTPTMAYGWPGPGTIGDYTSHDVTIHDVKFSQNIYWDSLQNLPIGSNVNLQGILAPGGVYNGNFYNITTDGTTAIAGNLFEHCSFYNWNAIYQRTSIDFGYNSHDVHILNCVFNSRIYSPSALITTCILNNDGSGDNEVGNCKWSGNKPKNNLMNINGSGDHLHDLDFNFPLDADTTVALISLQEDTTDYSHDNIFENISIRISKAKQLIRLFGKIPLDLDSNRHDVFKNINMISGLLTNAASSTFNIFVQNISGITMDNIISSDSAAPVFINNIHKSKFSSIYLPYARATLSGDQTGNLYLNDKWNSDSTYSLSGDVQANVVKNTLSFPGIYQYGDLGGNPTSPAVGQTFRSGNDLYYYDGGFYWKLDGVSGSGLGIAHTLQTLTLGNNTIAAGVTVYQSQNATSFQSSQIIRQPVVSLPGNVTNLTVTISNTQPATGNVVVTLMKNGSPTSLVVTIPANSVAGFYVDNIHSVSVSQGDLLSVQFTNNASVSSAPFVAAGYSLNTIGDAGLYHNLHANYPLYANDSTVFADTGRNIPQLATGGDLMTVADSLGGLNTSNAYNYFKRSGDSASYMWNVPQTVYTTPPISGTKIFDTTGRFCVINSAGKEFQISMANLAANQQVIDSLPPYSGTYVFKYNPDTIFNHIISGGQNSGNSLTLLSTTHATKGSIFFGSASAYDGVNFRLGIGTLTPSAGLHVINSSVAQIKAAYDANNYMTDSVLSTGSAVLDLVGTSPVFTFNKAIISGASGVALQTNSSAVNSNLVVTTTGSLNASNSAILFRGGTSTAYRAFMRGSTASLPSSGFSYGSLVIGQEAVTINAGGNTLFTSLAIKPLIITAGGSLPNNYTVYIDSTANGATANGGLWVADKVRIDGGLNANGTPLTANQVLGVNSAATATEAKTVPIIVASGRQTAQSGADASIAAFTVGGSDASFLVSANVLVTTSTLHTFTVTCTYTDEGNTSRTLTLQFSNLAGTFLTSIANAGGAVPYEGVPVRIRCKASSTITVASTGTFTTVVYNVESSITQTQ